MMDVENKYAVGSGGSGDIFIMNPPRGPISRKDALVLAAWLVTLAGNGDLSFEAIRDAVEQS